MFRSLYEWCYARGRTERRAVHVRGLFRRAGGILMKALFIISHKPTFSRPLKQGGGGVGRKIHENDLEMMLSSPGLRQ